MWTPEDEMTHSIESIAEGDFEMEKIIRIDDPTEDSRIGLPATTVDGTFSGIIDAIYKMPDGYESFSINNGRGTHMAALERQDIVILEDK